MYTLLQIFLDYIVIYKITIHTRDKKKERENSRKSVAKTRYFRDPIQISFFAGIAGRDAIPITFIEKSYRDVPIGAPGSRKTSIFPIHRSTEYKEEQISSCVYLRNYHRLIPFSLILRVYICNMISRILLIIVQIDEQYCQLSY